MPTRCNALRCRELEETAPLDEAAARLLQGANGDPDVVQQRMRSGALRACVHTCQGCRPAPARAHQSEKEEATVSPRLPPAPDADKPDQPSRCT